MGKISTYDNASPVTLTDKVIGTSVGGSPTDATKNFLISDLLTLFQGLPTKYTADFLIADWVANVLPSGVVYVYTLTAATHGRGISPIMQIHDATYRFIRTAGEGITYATTGVVGLQIGPEVVVEIVADNEGTAGNIAITTDGVSTLDSFVNTWNINNPTNTVTLTYIEGANWIGAGEVFTLSNGADIDSIKIETNGDIKVTVGFGGAFDGTIIVM
tara:strand:- start:15107 stop:15754 length:648 start_codon:yes stop_codon:yes gene_type:complete